MSKVSKADCDAALESLRVWAKIAKFAHSTEYSNTIRARLAHLEAEVERLTPKPCCMCGAPAIQHMPETGYSGEGWYCSRDLPGSSYGGALR